MITDGKIVTSVSLGQTEITPITVGNTSVSKIILGTYPICKGKIIRMDITGSGTPTEFTVISNNGTVAEVMTRYPVNNEIKFRNNGGNPYYASTLDTFLNETWYNTLSSSVKSAIVDKTFYQDEWRTIDESRRDMIHDYLISGSYSYNIIQLVKGQSGPELTRHCYVMSIMDVIKYLGAKPSDDWNNTPLTPKNISYLFNISGSDFRWILSVNTSVGVWRASSKYAFLGQNAALTSAVNGCFQIDLSVFTDWEVVQ